MVGHILKIDANPPYCLHDPKKFPVSSVAESARERLVNFERLTHAKAIYVLKEIKQIARIQSFFCNPLVHLPLLALTAIGSARWMMKTHSFALRILGLASLSISTSLLVTCLFFLPELLNTSFAYKEKSREAAEYLDALEKSQVEMNIEV